MEWDPIDVAGIPEAEDECDCMISPLLHHLFEGADTRSLVGWISHERSSHFGLGPDEAADTRLVESLAAWWERGRIEATRLPGKRVPRNDRFAERARRDELLVHPRAAE
ncbi:MAG: hypothetical protein ABSB76_29180 [Streptosporangiaceae bacterium]|jgi:hypothetical protein